MRPVLVGVSAILFWLVAHSAGAVQYKVVDLGDRPVVCINELGHALRTFVNLDPKSRYYGTGQLQLWEGQAWRDIAPHSALLGTAFAMNDHGDILVRELTLSGISSPPLSYGLVENSSAPFFFSGWRTAYDLNNHRVLVGNAKFESGSHAFMHSGALTVDLGTLGGHYSIAYAINDAGQIVGDSTLPPGPDGKRTSHAFLYENGTMRDLGSLPGYGYSTAEDINEHGTVAVNLSDLTSNVACIWSNGMLQPLGSLGGGNSYAEAINDHDHVVGEARLADGRYSAFIYRDGQMLDLTALVDPYSGWELEEARDINNAGQIIGSGYLNGEYRSFLLNPVPEPSTWVLAASALACLAVGALQAAARSNNFL